MENGKYPPSSLSSEFKRHSYSHPDFPRKVLVKYIGDETKAVDMPHGNAKSAPKLATPFTGTKKSVLAKIGMKIGKPAAVYKQLTLDDPKELASQPTSQVRDIQQVRNVQKRARKRQSLAGNTNIPSMVSCSNKI